MVTPVLTRHSHAAGALAARKRWRMGCILAVTWLVASAAASAGEPPAPPASAPAVSGASDLESLVQAGLDWWKENAPEELNDGAELPNIAQVQEFLARLETALEEGSFEDLARFEPEARQVLAFLRQTEAGSPWADWLEPRLDMLAAAVQLTAASDAERRGKPVDTPVTDGANVKPQQPADGSTSQAESRTARRTQPSTAHPAKRPQLARRYWEGVVVQRAPPRRAEGLIPQLKRIFVQQGVAPQWVWLAEVESSFNPDATSPVGARGLFQFMPATAERFGLRTSAPDERTHPERSAQAAAKYLRLLHRRFGSWDLALAAYNAGEGRVGRLLQSTGGRSYESIAARLPAETRLYVPKVLATVAVRETVDPERLPAPGMPSGREPKRVAPTRPQQAEPARTTPGTP